MIYLSMMTLAVVSFQVSACDEHCPVSNNPFSGSSGVSLSRLVIRPLVSSVTFASLHPSADIHVSHSRHRVLWSERCFRETFYRQQQNPLYRVLHLSVDVRCHHVGPSFFSDSQLSKL